MSRLIAAACALILVAASAAATTALILWPQPASPAAALGLARL